jgi:hypothetical protein
MKNMYGETTYCFEVLGPADACGESDTLAYTDDYSRPAAELWLRNEVRRGRFPKDSGIYRDTTTDARAQKAGYTVSHYDFNGGRK